MAKLVTEVKPIDSQELEENSKKPSNILSCLLCHLLLHFKVKLVVVVDHGLKPLLVLLLFRHAMPVVALFSR